MSFSNKVPISDPIKRPESISVRLSSINFFLILLNKIKTNYLM